MNLRRKKCVSSSSGCRLTSSTIRSDRFGVLIISLTLHLAPFTYAQSTWRVDAQATGANHGTSWAEAFSDLHDALAVAQAGDEIWIAQGVYKPDRRTRDRAMSFHLVDGVGIYGGFAGWETKREQRDWRENETILSGDLNDDDGPQDCAEHSNCCVPRPDEPGCDDPVCEALICGLYPDCCDERWYPHLGWEHYCAGYAEEFCCNLGNWNSCENSFVVASGTGLSAPTVLDGVTVLGAYPLDPTAFGAGVSVLGSTLTVANCAFRSNVRGVSGDFYSEVVAESCIVSDNLSGIDANGELRACTFVNNRSAAYGLRKAIDCFFSQNQVALYVRPNSEVRNCVFLENEGGIMARVGLARVSDSLFLRNRSGLSGNDSSAVVTNCVFLQHSDRVVDGRDSSVTMVNCLLADNFGVLGMDGGGGWGGAFYFNQSALRLKNCTVAYNQTYQDAGAINLFGEKSSLIVENSIIYGNSRRQGTQISLQSGPRARIDNSIVGDWDGTIPGVGTFDTDPRFMPGPAGDYYLSQVSAGHSMDSPAVDTGNDATANAVVFTRTTRSDEVLDAPPVDIGYHYPVTGKKLLLGDFDRNGRVDLFDVSGFQNCFDAAGANDPPPSCRIFDFDSNHDIAIADLRRFIDSMTP